VQLETAKNIGLACNLIDADMPPVFKAGMSLEECLQAFTQAYACRTHLLISSKTRLFVQSPD
jgi:hypothetical protein